MNSIPRPEDRTVLLRIQNSRKPDQIIHVVLDRSNGHFETQGLRDLFGVKEIRVETMDILRSLPEYAEVLSFLFESMSTAQDLNLPFGYQNEFEFGDARYTLYDEGDYRVLKKVGEEEEGRH
jgi:hypothetical protein